MVGFKRSLEDAWRIMYSYTVGSFELIENSWVNLSERFWAHTVDDSMYTDINGKVMDPAELFARWIWLCTFPGPTLLLNHVPSV